MTLLVGATSPRSLRQTLAINSNVFGNRRGFSPTVGSNPTPSTIFHSEISAVSTELQWLFR